MPDMSTISGGPSEVGSDAAASRGILITANASINTKATTWTEVIASTDYAANWLMVTMGGTAVATNAGYLVDVGIGGSTAEQVLIANLYAHLASAGSMGCRSFLFPLRIPAGSRLSLRAQSSTASAQILMTLHAISSGIAAAPGLGRVETIGAVTADSNGLSVDCGAVAHTDVVGELTATTSFAYKWFCLAVANPTDAVWANSPTNFLVDVCVGAGGSELAVISDLYFSGAGTDDRPNPGAVCFPCAIAAGSRVSVRARCGITTAGDRVLDYVGYGVG